MTPEEEERYLRQLELGIDEMLAFMGEKPKFFQTLSPEEQQQYLEVKRTFDSRPSENPVPTDFPVKPTE